MAINQTNARYLSATTASGERQRYSAGCGETRPVSNWREYHQSHQSLNWINIQVNSEKMTSATCQNESMPYRMVEGNALGNIEDNTK